MDFDKITNERGTKNCVYIRSCKMVLWPIRARVLFELFYNSKYADSIFKFQRVAFSWKIVRKCAKNVHKMCIFENSLES